MRRALTALVIALAALPLPARAASVPVLVIDGKGWGHGVGMAQDGAYWMGVQGATTEQILGQFYPGTSLGKGRGAVRVPVQDAGAAPSSAVLTFPNGGEVRDAPSGEQSKGFPVKVGPGGAVRVAWDGARYTVVDPNGPVALGPTRLTAAYAQVPMQEPPTILPPPPTSTTTTALPSSTTTTSDPSPTTAPTAPSATTLPPSSSTTEPPAPSEAPPPSGDAPAPAGPSSTRTLWAVPAEGGTVGVPTRDHVYRGVVEATGAGGTLRLVNQVDVESYLKGMGEVLDPHWPPAALRAQAIAARTYALRAMSAGGEICDTQRCQVYLGAQAEYGAMNAAVDATREQVLVYRNALASAVYSANAGGFSASREEGFGDGSGDVPYLRPAPYVTQDPAPWTVRVALTDVAARLGYRGRLSDVRVDQTGPSGRALEVVLDGESGARPVQGLAFAAALGLRSSLFGLRLEQGDAPPPPPPAADTAIQAPPDDAATLAAAPDGPTSTTAADRASRSHAVAVDVDPYGSGRRGLPPELLVVAGWLVVAGGCALGLVAPRPRRHGADRGQVI